MVLPCRRTGLAAIAVAMTTGLACTYDYDALGKTDGASTAGGATSSENGGPTSGGATPTSSGNATASSGGGSGVGGAGGGPGSSASTGTGGDGGGSASSTTTGTGGDGGRSASSTTTGTGTGGDGGGGAGPVCGDDLTDPPEECDDGALTPGDGCGPTCLVEEPDGCPGAPIPLDVGTLDITGNTSGADDTMQDSDGQGPCTTNSSAGPDFIYAVMPSSSGTLTATLDSSFDYHWLRARLGCPSGAELDCNYATGSGSDIQISFAVQAGATYYVVVDSWGGTQGGPFSLELALSL